MILVLTQKGTIEGYTAAWVAKRTLKQDCEIVQLGHGDPLPNFKGRDVLMFGVAFERAKLEQLKKLAKSLFVFDNDFHVKAQLGGLKYVKINMHQTAARMAWTYLRSDFRVKVGKERKSDFHFSSAPWIVDYSDRKDLWRWPEISSLYLSLAIKNRYEETLESWDELSTRNIEIVQEEGKEVARQKIKKDEDERILAAKKEKELVTVPAQEGNTTDGQGNFNPAPASNENERPINRNDGGPQDNIRKTKRKSK